MLQTLLEGDAIVWVEDENFLQEVDCLGRRPRVLLNEIRSWTCGELFQVLEGFQVSDETFVRLSWRADDLKDNRKLVIG